jgi:hypothetical protein
MAIEAQKAFPSLTPVTRVTQVGEIVIYPLGNTPAEKQYMRVYGPVTVAKVDTPKLTLLGKQLVKSHGGLKTMYDYTKKLVAEIEDPDLKHWEETLMMSEGDYRGQFDPYIYYGRLLAKQPKWYGSVQLPRWAHQSMQEIRPLSTLSQVEINEPHANTGFPWLKPMFPRGNSSDNTLSLQVLEKASTWMERVQGIEYPSRALLQSITPPSAAFYRFQSGGRPVDGVSKVVNLPQGLVAQPLQRMLEDEKWYAYGDRKKRFDQLVTEIFNGKVGNKVIDGDDFVSLYKLGIFSGDSSAFDASRRAVDASAFESAVKLIYKGDPKRWRTYIASRKAADAVYLVTGLGKFDFPYRHGVNSGSMDTHPEDSWLQASRWNSAKPWATVSDIVDRMGRVGSIMRAEAQILSKNWAFMAKLACNGQTLFGSAVRGIQGVCMYEDNPSQYGGPDDDDARVVAIVANSWSPEGPHPKWEKVVHFVKNIAKWELRGSKANVMRKAIGHLVKRRHFTRDETTKLTGVWERKALDATWSALT